MLVCIYIFSFTFPFQLSCVLTPLFFFVCVYKRIGRVSIIQKEFIGSFCFHGGCSGWFL